VRTRRQLEQPLATVGLLERTAHGYVVPDAVALEGVQERGGRGFQWTHRPAYADLVARLATIRSVTDAGASTRAPSGAAAPQGSQ